jgi:hypothetical protein
MKTLTLHVKRCYFEEIAVGTKLFEYRRANEHWTKVLAKHYDRLEICLGYPPRGDRKRRMRFAFTPPQLITLTHPHFGPHAVEVFALPLHNIKVTQ